FHFRNYQLFDGYFGARYYWDRWFNQLSFFLGAQIGLTHHRSSRADFTIFLVNPTQTVTFTDIELFRQNTKISGGVNFGFDICYNNWSLVINGEIIVSSGPRGMENQSNVILGNVETEVRFPITVGIRYTF